MPLNNFRSSASLDGVVKYWYHIAIMFEALFNLTTIDTGTRIARFLLQELLGKVVKRFEKVDLAARGNYQQLPSHGGLGAVDMERIDQTIWPMFWDRKPTPLVDRALRRHDDPSAEWKKQVRVRRRRFRDGIRPDDDHHGCLPIDHDAIPAVDHPSWKENNWPVFFRGSLCTAAIILLIVCFAIIFLRAMLVWFEHKPNSTPSRRPPLK